MFRLLRELVGVQMWQGAILACSALAQLAAARYIGPAGLGTSAVIMGGAALCIFLIELNLQSALVREISTLPEQPRQLLRDNVLIARVTLALAVGPIVGLWMYLDHRAGAVWIGTILAVLSQELNPGWWLQGIGGAANSYRIVGRASLLGCLLSLPVIYFTRAPGIETICMSSVGALAFLAYWSQYRLPNISARAIWTGIESYFVFAWRHKAFLVGGASFYLYLYPAKLILASTRGVGEAGIYGVAAMFGGAYYAIMVAAFNIYYPRFIAASEMGSEIYRMTVRRVGIIIVLSGLVAWGGLMLGRGLVLGIVGDQFTVSLILAPALLISKILAGLVLVLRGALLAKGREKLSFGTFFLVQCLALAARFYIIPKYGILGAAIVEGSQEIIHLLILSTLLFRVKNNN